MIEFCEDEKVETNLTKRIKALTHSYKPKLHSSMRTIRWADEVWTPTCIVDSIRFEDYYINEEYLYRLIDADRYSEVQQQTSAHVHNLGECFRDGSTMKDDKKYHGCILRSHLWNVDMMVTCFDFYPELSIPEDFVRMEFLEHYCIPENEPILKHINFTGCDNDLMQDANAHTIPYGINRRNDKEMILEYSAQQGQQML